MWLMCPFDAGFVVVNVVDAGFDVFDREQPCAACQANWTHQTTCERVSLNEFDRLDPVDSCDAVDVFDVQSVEPVPAQ